MHTLGQNIVCTNMLCSAALCSALLCSAVLCCAVLCCAVLCCAVLCCAVLCCAVLCCAVLCCAVLCCAMYESIHRYAMQCDAMLSCCWYVPAVCIHTLITCSNRCMCHQALCFPTHRSAMTHRSQYMHGPLCCKLYQLTTALLLLHACRTYVNKGDSSISVLYFTESIVNTLCSLTSGYEAVKYALAVEQHTYTPD
jgi:hypothetical protein